MSSNIKTFLEANYYYYKNKLAGSPEYIKEQIYYRLEQCKEDCLIEDKCIYCECPPRKRSWAKESCNDGERFPDLMNKLDWEEFKENNYDKRRI